MIRTRSVHSSVLMHFCKAPFNFTPQDLNLTWNESRVWNNLLKKTSPIIHTAQAADGIWTGNTVTNTKRTNGQTYGSTKTISCPRTFCELRKYSYSLFIDMHNAWNVEIDWVMPVWHCLLRNVSSWPEQSYIFAVMSVTAGYTMVITFNLALGAKCTLINSILQGLWV